MPRWWCWLWRLAGSCARWAWCPPAAWRWRRSACWSSTPEEAASRSRKTWNLGIVYTSALYGAQEKLLFYEFYPFFCYILPLVHVQYVLRLLPVASEWSVNYYCTAINAEKHCCMMYHTCVWCCTQYIPVRNIARYTPCTVLYSNSLLWQHYWVTNLAK